MKKSSILALQFIVFLTSCHLQTEGADLKKTTLLSPSGDSIALEIAYDDQAQRQGLSGRKASELCNECGMLFYYQQDSSKSFWMPDTYFALDIFFLDQDLRIIEIERDVPPHPGFEEPPTIARTASIYSRHVLEMRSDSPLAKKLQKKMQLIWKNQNFEKEVLKNAKKLFD